MHIGLDASTSTIGWAFCDDNKIIDAGFLDISKIPGNKTKALTTIDFLEKNKNFKDIKHINLEAALSGFMMGKTSQQTIILLTRWNAVFEYIMSEKWNIPINLISVSAARKNVFGKCRVKGMSGKDYVKTMLPKIHPEILNFEKTNRNNDWDKKNGDMYDAVVMALSKL